MGQNNVQCNNAVDVKDNYSNDERYAPTFRWHTLYGPGHILGPVGSKYFRSSVGIPCTLRQQCRVLLKTEKELVRHLKGVHKSKNYQRTPNLKFCRRVDLTKVATTPVENTEDILLPLDGRKRRSKNEVKSDQSKSDNSKPAQSSKVKNTSKPKTQKSDVLPDNMAPSSSVVAVGATSQRKSVIVPNVTAADSDSPALPLPLDLSLASGSGSKMNLSLNHSPEKVYPVVRDVRFSAADITHILADAHNEVCELDEYRNRSLNVKYTESFIPTNLEEFSNVLRQVLVEHFDLTKALYGGVPKMRNNGC